MAMFIVCIYNSKAISKQLNDMYNNVYGVTERSNKRYNFKYILYIENKKIVF